MLVYKRKLFLFGMLLVCGIDTPAVCDGIGSYDNLVAALNNAQSACVGISDKLSDLKRMAGINTAVTAVGTVGGAVALGTGIAKARVDKEIEDRLQEAVTGNYSRAGDQSGLQNIPTLSGTSSTGDNQTKTQKADNELENKSKTLGHVRTGAMAVAGASNVVGAVIASKNSSQDDLVTQIAKCSETMNDLTAAQMQVRADGSDPDGTLLQKADNVILKCKMIDKVDLSDVIKKAKGAMISSTVGAATGVVGAVVSALANSQKIRDGDDQTEKNLNTASNVLAGTTTVASGAAVFFNATQIGTVKQMAAIAEDCEGAF